MVDKADAAKAANEVLNQKFLEQAFQIAALPTLCTKFQLFPAPENFAVLVLGGGVILQPQDGEPATSSAVFGAVLFNKTFAADLLLNMEVQLGITDEDKAAARARNPNLGKPADGK
jgi:hypothetical protein